MVSVSTAITAPLGVWRVGAYGRFIAGTITAAPGLAALFLWISALVNLSGEIALGALAATAAAAVMALFAWWTALRPKLVVTAEEVVVVNPWGTQRVALADVVAVTPGFSAAQVQLRNGFCLSSWALADAAGALTTGGRRAHEVSQAIADARQRTA